MQIKPNRTILEGQIRGMKPAVDGWGADVEFSVARTAASAGFQDFVGAQPGDLLTMFAAQPAALTAGGNYRIVASVRGGPLGERVILEQADLTGG